MQADKDGCTCFDETTRKCPIAGHPQSNTEINVQTFGTRKGTFMTVTMDNSVVLGWFTKNPDADRQKVFEIGPDVHALRQWQRDRLL